MSEKFACPNCGAPLDAPANGESTLRCSFCNSSVIVPEELRTHTPPHPAIIFTPEEPPYQPVSTTTSTYHYSSVDDAAVKKIAKRTAAGAGCFSIGVTVIIILAIGIGILVMLALPGGPLDSFWAKANPAAYNHLELEFGGEGTGPGLFTDARAIAVDYTNGNIYVADYQGGRVQSFDATGKFIVQWNVGDRKTIISSLAADRKGSVFVVAAGKLLQYDGANGKLLGEVPHAEDLDFYEYAVTTADGGLAAVDSNETIVKLDSEFNVTLTIPDAIATVSGDSELDTKVAVDGSGNFYVMGSFNYGVFKFGPDGKFINRFGGEGDQPGQFQAMEAIAVDGKGQVFVSDINGIQVFDPDGRYIRIFDIPGATFGMVFNDQSELLAASNDQKVRKYSFKE
jgi:streptogramin lyase